MPRIRIAAAAATLTLLLAACGGDPPTKPDTNTQNPPPPPAPVASIELTPNTAEVGIARTKPFTATPRDAAGNALSGRVLTWASSDTLVAKVANGMVTGVAIGNVTISV